MMNWIITILILINMVLIGVVPIGIINVIIVILHVFMITHLNFFQYKSKPSWKLAIERLVTGSRQPWELAIEKLANVISNHLNRVEKRIDELASHFGKQD